MRYSSGDKRGVKIASVLTLFILVGCGQSSPSAVSQRVHKSELDHSSSAQKLTDGEPTEPKQNGDQTQEIPNRPDKRERLIVRTALPKESEQYASADPPRAPLKEESVPEAVPVFRASDSRSKHDAAKLETLGIRTFESRRLRLHTDINADDATSLPKIIDAAYDAWVDYFGPLPPNREATEYQMTGYLMKDRELFRRAGLLPEDLPQFFHGRHRGAEFWLNEQESDYYRRHLLIHEATHCFMTTLEDVRAPAWYMEGMAELFGTHRIPTEGTVEFRVMPDSEEHFPGLGRMRMVRADVAHGRVLSLNDADRLRPEEFAENSNYGWAWALCQFLDSHPRYRDRFRKLGRYTTGTQFATKLPELFRSDQRELNTEWVLFATNLQFSYDIERAVIDFRDGKPAAEDRGPTRINIVADRGWQSSGVLVEKGKSYDLSATGQFTLADEPVPWISEPQGVSLFYSEGHPIGQLLAAIDSSSSQMKDKANAVERPTESMLEVIPVGRQARFTAPVTGTLYLRVNDFWRSLADNKGTVAVEIHQVSTPHE